MNKNQMNPNARELSGPYIYDSRRLRVSQVDFWSNGVVYIRLDDHTEVQLNDAVELYKLLRSRFNGRDQFNLLVEPGLDTGITKEAREYASLPEKNEMTRGTAVIIKSLAHRILINFIINVTRQQTMKMRMFDSEVKAIEWLLSLES